MGRKQHRLQSQKTTNEIGTNLPFIQEPAFEAASHNCHRYDGGYGRLIEATSFK